MKKNFILVAALLLAGSLLSLLPAQGEAKDFFVKSFSPEGLVTGSVKIVVEFSNAVSGAVRSKGASPLAFYPDLTGKGIWKDASTFVFSPNGGLLAPATSYRAEVSHQLKDEDGNKLMGRQLFTFHSKPLEFFGARQVDYNQGNGMTTLELSFSLPVSPNRLMGYLEVKTKNGSPLQILPSGPASKRPRVSVRIPKRFKDIELQIEKGLPAENGNLGVAESAMISLCVTPLMEVMYAGAQSRITGGVINVGTSSPVDFSTLASFIEITPKAPFTLEPMDSGFVIAGDFAPQDRVRLTLKPGLASYDGKKLATEWSRAFIFPERPSEVRFPSPGRVISPKGSMRIPIEMVNLDAVEILVWKLYENNIPEAMKGRWDYYPTRLSELVAEKTYNVRGERNAKVKRALDLKSIINDGRGVFMISARNTANHWQESRQVVNVTDLGITVSLGPESLKVWVNSLSGASPIKGAEVTLWSMANQPIAVCRTDRSGEASCYFGKTSSEPALVTVKKDNDISFARLSKDLFKGRDEFDPSGRRWIYNGYDVCCALPRGIFRPGERLEFMCVLRGKDMTAPGSFPLSAKIFTSMGRVYAEMTQKLTDSGTASFAFDIPKDAPLGTWRVKVFVPGSDNPIGGRQFYVEEFAAPRLFVETKATGLPFMEKNRIGLSVSSKHVFGTPAAGLSWESIMTLAEREFTSKFLPAYRFINEDKSFTPCSRYIDGGRLDENGETRFFLNGDEWQTPSIADIIVKTGVTEEGGRIVYDTLTLPWYPTSRLLGIKLPDSMLTAGQPFEFSAALADINGKAVAGDTVKYTLYRTAYRYVRYENADGGVATKREEELIKRSDGELTVKEGTYTGTVTPEDSGRYLLIVEEPLSKARAARYFYAYGLTTNDMQAPDEVVLTADKKVYKIGDTARIKVKSPFEGRFIVEVGTYKSVYSSVEGDKGKECEISLKITRDMLPNAWVSVHSLRPARKDGEPVRACGLLCIDIDDSNSKLGVAVEGGTVEPGKRNFSLLVTDACGRGVAADVFVILTDEAVLGLTGYKTPDPWKYFMKRHELGMGTYDIYGFLIEPAADSVTLLTPGGGSIEAEATNMKSNLNPITARRFNILSLTKSLKSDNTGKCKFTLDIPEFAGQGRLIAIAVTDKAMGSGESVLDIHRDTVLEAAFPVALAPGDEFTSLCSVFNKSDKAQEISISVDASGGLELTSAPAADMTVEPGASLKLPLTWKAVSTGVAKAVITANWNNDAIQDVTELPIRPATAKLLKGGAVIVAIGEDFEHTVQDVWHKGTVNGSVILSSMPSVSLVELSHFLFYVPQYGMEQTVTAAWPLLLRPDLVKGIDPSMSDEVSVKKELEHTIQRILAHQTYDGGFSRTSGYGESQPWESIYAIHFLTEAEKSGYKLPNGSKKAAIAYLFSSLPQTYLESDDENEWRNLLSRKAYICYVLTIADEAPLGWMETLREKADSLTPSGRLLLAAAYAASGNKSEAKAMLGKKTLPLPKAYRGKNYDSDLRNLAFELLARAETDPVSAESASSAASLLERVKDTKYMNTQEGGFAMLALAKFFHAQPVEGKASGTLTAGGCVCEVEAKRQTVCWNTGEIGTFKVTNSGKSRLFVAWSFTGVPVEKSPEQDNGIKLRQTLMVDGKPIGAKITQGTRIDGRLTITPLSGALKDVVVVVPLPSGLEIDSKYVERKGGSPYSSASSEKRDDRLLLYIENVYGPVTWDYTMRAVTPGKFAVPQISAECLYSPSLFSVTRFMDDERIEIVSGI